MDRLHLHTPVTPLQLRQFGLLLAGATLISGVWPLFARQAAPHAWLLGCSALALALAFLSPVRLRPAYRVWMTIGHVLGEINLRLLLGVLFYGVLTPLGFLRRRLLKLDGLARGFDPTASTYRVLRHPRPVSHLTQQF